MLDDRTSNFDAINEVLSKGLIGCRAEKLIKYGLVPKLFLCCLFITLNAVDKQFVERARVLCLGMLPLMFADTQYRAQVEIKIKDTASI
jgi:hypothetical protein